MLAAASRHLPELCPTLVADSGAENVSGEVDRLIELGQIRRVLAQIEVSFSNSMIEAWWRNLKHAWLYLHTLDSASAAERLVAFYVEQHNTVMPHRAFDGRTPDKIYFGMAGDLAEQLAERRRRARVGRVAANRAITCTECAPQQPPAEPVAREPA